MRGSAKAGSRVPEKKSRCPMTSGRRVLGSRARRVHFDVARCTTMKRWPSVLLCLLALPGLSRASQAHAVVSPAVPDAVFHVDDGLVALPTLQFPIRDQTDAERRLFVDVSGGIVRRMLVLQFETVKPGSDFRFVFPPKPPRNFGPHVYRFGAYAYDDTAAAAREPALEAARTRAALLARGLQAPRFWHVV